MHPREPLPQRPELPYNSRRDQIQLSVVSNCSATAVVNFLRLDLDRCCDEEDAEYSNMAKE